MYIIMITAPVIMVMNKTNDQSAYLDNLICNEEDNAVMRRPKKVEKERAKSLFSPDQAGYYFTIISCVDFALIEMFYLNSTLNSGIPQVLVFQLEVYYQADRHF